jgi:gamma-glutamylcyclotransferase (GGCT)/AIG2-like uncharacterized protein YtfP
MNRLFCYGTLQVPQVIKAVTGRTYRGVPAALRGYAIFKVTNAEFPGVIRATDSTVEGIAYENVSAKDLNLLDLFEGDFYRRQLLDVVLPDGSISKAWVYVIADSHKDVLTDKSWSLTEFIDSGLDRFMKGYVMGRRNIYSGNKE